MALITSDCAPFRTWLRLRYLGELLLVTMHVPPGLNITVSTPHFYMSLSISGQCVSFSAGSWQVGCVSVLR